MKRIATILAAMFVGAVLSSIITVAVALPPREDWADAAAEKKFKDIVLTENERTKKFSNLSNTEKDNAWAFLMANALAKEAKNKTKEKNKDKDK